MKKPRNYFSPCKFLIIRNSVSLFAEQFSKSTYCSDFSNVFFVYSFLIVYNKDIFGVN